MIACQTHNRTEMGGGTILTPRPSIAPPPAARQATGNGALRIEFKDGTHLVIGIGNRFANDDGVGPYVAELLAWDGIPGVDVVQCVGDGLELMDAFDAYENVIIIGAICAGAGPGSIQRFDANHEILKSNFFRYSSHVFGVAEAIELSRAIKTLPRSVILYGIEGESFDSGTTLSRAVIKSADILTKVLKEGLIYALGQESENGEAVHA